MQNAINGNNAKFIAKECIQFYPNYAISVQRLLRICMSVATIFHATHQACIYFTVTGQVFYGILHELYDFYNSLVIYNSGLCDI